MAEQKYFFLNMIPAGVQGGCTKQGHINWLELDSWSFQMYQSAEPNTLGGRPDNTSSSGSFSFTIKYTDPMIFANCSSGNLIAGPITFEAERGGLTQAGSAGTLNVKTTGTYLQLQFSNVVVHAWSMGGDAGLKQEDVSFSFEKLQMTYHELLNNGTLGPAITRTYDSKSLQATVVS